MIEGAYISSAATLTGYLDSRYSNTCTFNAIMGNIWTNYFNVKNSALNPTNTGVGVGVLGRATAASTKIQDTTIIGGGGVFGALNIMNTLFTSMKTNMNSISTLTDPNYGLLAGLNCAVFG
jgi:hypothetical protein